MSENGWIIGILISVSAGFLLGVAVGFARGETSEGRKGDKRLVEVSRRYSVAMSDLRFKLRQKGVDLVALGIDPPVTSVTTPQPNVYPVTCVSTMAPCKEYDPPDPYKDLRTRAPWEKC
jgi:hypothetical protein